MGLVDHEVRFPRLIDGGHGHASEGRTRGEDIVVIADHDVGFLCPVKLQLEGQTSYSSPRSRNIRALSFLFLARISRSPCSATLA